MEPHGDLIWLYFGHASRGRGLRNSVVMGAHLEDLRNSGMIPKRQSGKAGRAPTVSIPSSAIHSSFVSSCSRRAQLGRLPAAHLVHRVGQERAQVVRRVLDAHLSRQLAQPGQLVVTEREREEMRSHRLLHESFLLRSFVGRRDEGFDPAQSPTCSPSSSDQTTRHTRLSPFTAASGPPLQEGDDELERDRGPVAHERLPAQAANVA
jgi:hypothetical protein